MYEGVKTSVRTSGGEIEDFPINIRLHQGSALSLFLFTLVMDKHIEGTQDDVPWCVLFASDIIPIDETMDEFNTKLEQWRYT